MTPQDLTNKTIARRGSTVLLVVGLAASSGVYLGHEWFHERLLSPLGIDPALGDALGSFIIILVAYLGQRLASLAVFRDFEFGRTHSALQLQQANREMLAELDELGRVASTDKLTGCWNRHRLGDVAKGEIDRLTRYNHALSLLIIDVDFFKRINDKHGHNTGDRVLIELADLIMASLRASDSLTRWGGEEFVVLCPSTTLTTAVVLADRLREKVLGAAFPTDEPVTVSIGVAECLTDESWDAWFQRADAALYRAKKNGRNQVQHAPETPSRTDAAALGEASQHLVQMVWHQAYACGDAVIDRQHQALFSVANELLAAILAQRPSAELKGLVDLLIREVSEHFVDEEAIVASTAYPAFAEHAAMHRTLVGKAAVLAERFQAGSLEAGELFQFLAHDLIVRHILGADRDYFSYLPIDAVSPSPSAAG